MKEIQNKMSPSKTIRELPCRLAGNELLLMGSKLAKLTSDASGPCHLLKCKW